MNTEKAIKLLREMQEAWKLQITGDAFDALEMAINALQELNNSNQEVNNSTATQSNGIESKVKGLTACRVPEPTTNGSIYAETVEKQDDRTTNDSISRQAAIDELETHRALYCNHTPESFSRLSYADKSRVDEIDGAIAVLVNLPSVQPEIIRCKDCRKYRRLGCPMGITVFDAPDPDGYCYKSERRTDEPDK